MSKLTLREYTAGFILLSFTLTAVLSFSGGFFDAYNTELTGENQDTVNELNKNIENANPDPATNDEQVNNINTETDTFFLSSVLTVIQSVTQGIGSIPTLANSLISGLNLDPSLTMLLSIPVAAVIWEVVSLYRGLRT